ncbi:MAG: 4-alpha-glucanotransferase [Elusimicrobia bacterium]|nr:4-alpha-glucanotransferase [Elusimicrobiota bacterium]
MKHSFSLQERSSGVLLHVSSLPGPFGVGDLGAEARAFADFLSHARQRWWQMLPVSPEGPGDSPYHSTSAFAGNPIFISIGGMADAGLIDRKEAEHGHKAGVPGRADFAHAHRAKDRMLNKAFARFCADGGGLRRRDAQAFCHSNDDWLSEFALFAALKRHHHGAPWNSWDEDLRVRRPEALSRARARLAKEVEFEKFLQFEFDRQWRALREYAASKGVGLIGDVPIYVSHDSSDVWAHQDLFFLDHEGRSTVVAGVPPDYFSETGQLWGNPLYRWDVHKGLGYAWWIARLKKAFERFDVARLDHFIGFQRYWEVPAGEETAVRGRWVPGPGSDIFRHALAALKGGQIIAEDLGIVTDEVVRLREAFSFPGMRVLQFAFGSDSKNTHLPHNFTPDSVVYTGTHDNDTAVGWFFGEEAEPAAKRRKEYKEERSFALRYMNSDGWEVHWDLIRLATASVARTAVFPVQDLLGLGDQARMNRPGKTEGNWAWRLEPGALTHAVGGRLADLALTYGRG